MPRVLAVNFHYVRAQTPSDRGLHPRSPRQFRAQLEHLSEYGEFIHPQRLASWLEGDEVLADGDYFTLTFDDGLRDHYDLVAPEVERRGWRVFFFVVTSPWQGKLPSVHRLHLLLSCIPFGSLRRSLRETLDHDFWLRADALPDQIVRSQYRYDAEDVARVKYALNFLLSQEQRDVVLHKVFSELLGDEARFVADLYMKPIEVAELACRGHVVGLHSHSHRPLAMLEKPDQEWEIDRNKELLERAIGSVVWAISYPYGGPSAVSPQVSQLCRERGLRVGFTMARGYIEPGSDPLLLNRVDTNDAPGGKKPAFRLERRA